MLDHKPLEIKVNYTDGNFKISVNNYKTIGEFKKKICRLYGLGSDIIIADENNRIYNQNIIFEYCPEEVWLCISNSGMLYRAELKRFEYEVMKNDSYHNFNAMIFSAWNRLALRRYINILIGGENRLMEIYVDGNLWDDEEMTVNITRMKVKALPRKRDTNG
jgi:hypothetical protein